MPTTDDDPPGYEPCGAVSPPVRMDTSSVITTVTCPRPKDHDIRGIDEAAKRHRGKVIIEW